jgi:hypothetical protein
LSKSALKNSDIFEVHTLATSLQHAVRFFVKFILCLIASAGGNPRPCENDRGFMRPLAVIGLIVGATTVYSEVQTNQQSDHDCGAPSTRMRSRTSSESCSRRPAFVCSHCLDICSPLMMIPIAARETTRAHPLHWGDMSVWLAFALMALVAGCAACFADALAPQW